MQAKTHYPDQFQGVCGVVAELLITDAEYELAIEVALGSDIQSVITETAEDAQDSVAFLKKHRAGRVKFSRLILYANAGSMMMHCSTNPVSSVSLRT